MIGYLSSIIEFFGYILGLLNFVLEFGITKLHQIFVALSYVFGFALGQDSPVPLGLRAIAMICCAVLLTRFIWNAVRGSGA